MGFVEEPLFGPAQELEPVDWPALPAQPSWRRLGGDPGLLCDYCARSGDGPARRAVWHRTGVDAAVLLLCRQHADLFAEDTGRVPHD